MISYPHALMNSCSRALQPSCPLAIVPPSSRIGKNQVTRCYFVIWLLVSSSLTLSPALSSSQAKAYAPSVTRFPFLLVQVFAEALIHRKYRWIVAFGRRKGLREDTREGSFVEDVSHAGAIMSKIYRKYAWIELLSRKGLRRRPETSPRP